MYIKLKNDLKIIVNCKIYIEYKKWELNEINVLFLSNIVFLLYKTTFSLLNVC